MEKLTYLVALDSAIACDALSTEIRDKLNALRTQLAKKSDSTKKPTKNQTANSDLQEVIYNGMENGKPYTVTDLMKSIPELAELSNQKVSAMMRQLKLDNRVSREEIKGKSYFTRIA